MNSSIEIDIRAKRTANEFATELVFALSEYYSVPVSVVLELFDKTGYWKVINDDDVCCELAHDGVRSTIEDMQGEFDEVLSWNR